MKSRLEHDQLARDEIVAVGKRGQGSAALTGLR